MQIKYKKIRKQSKTKKIRKQSKTKKIRKQSKTKKIRKQSKTKKKYTKKVNKQSKKLKELCPSGVHAYHYNCPSWKKLTKKKNKKINKCPYGQSIQDGINGCSNLYPPKGYYCKDCVKCKCTLSGLNKHSCGQLCCSSIPTKLKKKQKYKFGSPTHYDGSHPCYKKCPRGMTSKGNGNDWDTCFKK